MFFTFPEDTHWNAERQAVEFGVEVGEYRGRGQGPAARRWLSPFGPGRLLPLRVWDGFARREARSPNWECVSAPRRDPTNQLPQDIELCTRRHADPARFCQCFQTSGNVDAIAEDVTVLDHDVAHIDADAELDAFVRGHSCIALVMPACTSDAQFRASTTLPN